MALRHGISPELLAWLTWRGSKASPSQRNPQAENTFDTEALALGEPQLNLLPLTHRLP